MCMYVCVSVRPAGVSRRTQGQERAGRHALPADLCDLRFAVEQTSCCVRERARCGHLWAGVRDGAAAALEPGNFFPHRSVFRSVF